MCKIRFLKYINNILNIFGRDVFILKNIVYSGVITIYFQCEKVRISGRWPAENDSFDTTESSPDDIMEYQIPTPESGSRTVVSQITCYNAVYLEINGTVYIDRR